MNNTVHACLEVNSRHLRFNNHEAITKIETHIHWDRHNRVHKFVYLFLSTCNSRLVLKFLKTRQEASCVLRRNVRVAASSQIRFLYFQMLEKLLLDLLDTVLR